MNYSSFEKLLSITPEFSETRNYWLVRTQGGLYYEHFKKGNFIGIGFNEINLFDIYESVKDKKKPLNLLTKIVKDRLPEETKAGYVSSQLYKFVFEIRKGDIVVIPSESSDILTLGEVQETPVEIVENPSLRPEYLPVNASLCEFIKRKKVAWYKDVKKYNLEPRLYKMLFSHHIITEANEYGNAIDTLMSNFYIKGNEAVIVLEVATENDIKARTLFQMGDFLLQIVDEFCKYHNLPINSDDVEVKLNLQSPGKIQLSSKTKASIAIIGLLVIGVVGGGFKVKYQNFELDLSTDGIVQKIIDFQNNAFDREAKQQILDKHLKNLQVKEPDDLIKVLEINQGKDSNKNPENIVQESDTDTTSIQ